MTSLRLRYFVYAFWLLAISAGAVVLFRYEQTAGRSGETPNVWPAKSSVTPSATLPTLVMFVHPKCPCTRASIEELNRFLASYASKVSTHVLFIKPAGTDQEWTHSSSWDSVSRIPGVSLAEDPDGIEALRFGAETSGYVVLFSAKGQLLFSGGITGGRGHAGENSSEATLAAALNTFTPSDRTPVYGCSLMGTCRMPTEGSVSP